MADGAGSGSTGGGGGGDGGGGGVGGAGGGAPGLTPRAAATPHGTAGTDDTDSTRPRVVVLVGGGHAHVQVIKGLHTAFRRSNLEVVLIDKNDTAFYSGMMPGCVAGLYAGADTHIQLRPLAAWAGIRFIHAEAAGIDAGAGRPCVGWLAVVWRGVVWRGVVWRGVVWCGVCPVSVCVRRGVRRLCVCTVPCMGPERSGGASSTVGVGAGGGGSWRVSAHPTDPPPDVPPRARITHTATSQPHLGRAQARGVGQRRRGAV